METDPTLAQELRRAGGFHLSAGEYCEAEHCFAQALALLEQQPGTD
jgi:hypothetical protein